MSDVVAEAAAAALGGALVVLPTDTVYGIGTRPDDPSATGRVFAAKGRPRDLELPVLVASLVSAASVAVFDGRARALAERFWPGPLTIVLPRSTGSTAWDLGGDRATVGVRQPRHRLALAVLERAGPLAVTSANRSGSPPALTCDELEATFGDLVEVYLCEEAPLVGAPSTVVDLAHGAAEILREGAVPGNDVRAALDGTAQPSAEGDG